MNDKLLKEENTGSHTFKYSNSENQHIPVSRIIDKLDNLLSKNDYPAAEQHLNYWRNEAENLNDQRGLITVLNEQIGLFRKLGKERDCLEAINHVLKISDNNGMNESVSFGTTLINAATGYKAFGRTDLAVPLYRKAKIIYETSLDKYDGRLGGLYNNMALAVADLGNYREAEELFFKAVNIMSGNSHCEGEMAITYLNLADLIASETGLDSCDKRIDDYLERAELLLNTDGLPRDGSYAFICEKCAPVFGYYGHFMTERELKRRAAEIYERS